MNNTKNKKKIKKSKYVYLDYKALHHECTLKYLIYHLNILAFDFIYSYYNKIFFFYNLYVLNIYEKLFCYKQNLKYLCDNIYLTNEINKQNLQFSLLSMYKI